MSSAALVIIVGGALVNWSTNWSIIVISTGLLKPYCWLQRGVTLLPEIRTRYICCVKAIGPPRQHLEACQFHVTGLFGLIFYLLHTKGITNLSLMRF